MAFLDPDAVIRRVSITDAHQVETSGLCWMAVHGVLCLGLRHPGYKGPSRPLVLAFVLQLGRQLVAWGVLTREELAAVEKLEQQESPHGGG